MTSLDGITIRILPPQPWKESHTWVFPSCSSRPVCVCVFVCLCMCIKRPLCVCVCSLQRRNIQLRTSTWTERWTEFQSDFCGAGPKPATHCECLHDGLQPEEEISWQSVRQSNQLIGRPPHHTGQSPLQLS